MKHVSHSELSSYLTCPRKHHHAYRDRRVSRTVAEPLTTGRRVDQALKGEVVDLPPLERALVDGHRARWGNTLGETEQAVWFEVQIAPEVTVVGEIDAMCGDDVIVERKTTSESIEPGSLFWRRFIKLDPQVSTYLLAKPKAKYVLVDAMRKSGLKGKKGESDDDLYDRALTNIAEDLDRHYQRVQIVRLDQEHAAHVRDILGTVRLIQIADEDASYGRLPPRNPKSCMGWGRACEYLDVCTGETTIDNDLLFETKKERPANGYQEKSSETLPRQ